MVAQTAPNRQPTQPFTKDDPPASLAAGNRSNRTGFRWCGLWTDRSKEDGEYFTSWMNSGQKRPLGLIIRRNKSTENNLQEAGYLFFLSPHVKEERGQRLSCPGANMLCVGEGKLIRAKTGNFYINGTFLNGYLSVFKSTNNPPGTNRPPYFAMFILRSQAGQQKNENNNAGMTQEDSIPF